jgi:hypothetical protein
MTWSDSDSAKYVGPRMHSNEPLPYSLLERLKFRLYPETLSLLTVIKLIVGCALPTQQVKRRIGS